MSRRVKCVWCDEEAVQFFMPEHDSVLELDALSFCEPHSKHVGEKNLVPHRGWRLGTMEEVLVSKVMKS